MRRARCLAATFSLLFRAGCPGYYGVRPGDPCSCLPLTAPFHHTCHFSFSCFLRATACCSSPLRFFPPLSRRRRRLLNLVFASPHPCAFSSCAFVRLWLRLLCLDVSWACLASNSPPFRFCFAWLVGAYLGGFPSWSGASDGNCSSLCPRGIAFLWPVLPPSSWAVFRLSLRNLARHILTLLFPLLVSGLAPALCHLAFVSPLFV